MTPATAPAGRVDAHHHLLDPTRHRYPWIADAFAPLGRRWTPEELAPQLRAAGVDATVLVQTVHSRDETLDLLAFADATPWIAGVVGWVDLTAPDVDEQLAALRAAPGGARYLKGIRHNVHDEPDPEWLARDDVLAGLARLAAAGLPYDLLVRTRELPAAIAVADALPDLRLVLDHLAKPPIADGWSEAWAAGVAALAERPNVLAKVSGLVTEADWDRWTADDLARPVAHALEAFGPRRLMAGSDWPVCTLAASYAEVAGATRAVLGDDADAELWGANAVACYALADTLPSAASAPTDATPS